MARSLGSISVDLLLRTASFESDMGRAKRIAARDAKAIAREMDVAAKRIGTGLGLALAGAAVGLTALVRNQLRAAEAAGETAQKVGVTVEALTSLTYAAKQSGVQIGTLQLGLTQLNKRIADAAQGGKYSKAFDALGVSIKDASGDLKTADEILRELAGKFATFKDGPEKAALAMQLFGKSGAELIPLLNAGSAGIKTLEERAASLGLVISTKTAKDADEFGDRLDDVTALGLGLGNVLAAKLLPALNLTAKAFGEAAEQSDALEKIGNGVVVVVDAIGRVAIAAYGSVRLLGAAFAGLVDSVNRLLEQNPAETLGQYAKGALQAASGSPFEAMSTFEQAFAESQRRAKEANKGLADGFKVEFDDVLANMSSWRAAMDTENGKVGKSFRNVKGGVVGLKAPLVDLGSDGAAALKKLADEAAKAEDEFQLLLQDMRDFNFDENVKSTEEYQQALKDALVAAVELRQAEFERTMDQRAAQAALEDEIEILKATGDEREDLIDAAEREQTIRRMLTGVVAEGTEAYKRQRLELDALLKQEQQRARIQGAAGVLSGVFGNATQGLANGDSPFEALRNAAVGSLDDITDSLGKVFKGIKRNKDGTLDFADAFKTLGDIAQEILPEISQFIGAAVGGGGQGAATGAGIGGAIGSAIGTAILPGIGTAIGAAIGSIIGGLIGGNQDDDPEIHVAGAGQRFSGAEGTQTSGFGSFNLRTTEIDISARQLRDTLNSFDRAILDFLPTENIAAATARFRTFDVKFTQLAQVLQARFDVILGTFSTDVQGFIADLALGLEGQVQALADVVELMKLETRGKLETGNLADTLDLIGELGTISETVGQSYQRLALQTAVYEEALSNLGSSVTVSRSELVRMADAFAEFAGGIQQAASNLKTFFDYFYTPQELLERNITRTSTERGDALSGIGLSASTTDAEFRAFFESAFAGASAEYQAQLLDVGIALAAAGDAQEAYTRLLVETADELRDLMRGIGDELEEIDGLTLAESLARIAREMDETVSAARILGATESQLGMIRLLAARQAAAAIRATEASAADLIESLYGGGNDIAGGLVGVAGGIDAVGEAIGNFRNEMLLDSGLSPLSIQKQFEEALRQAYATGDDSIKRRALELARQLHGSGSDYLALFNQITAIPSRNLAQQAQDLGGGGPSQAEQEQTALARLRDAQSLADLVAQLATAQDRSFEDIATQLGLDLSALATDLGLEDLSALNEYLTALSQPASLTPTLAELSMIGFLQEIADILAGRRIIATALGLGDGKPPGSISTPYSGPYDGPFDPVTGEPIGGPIPEPPPPGGPTPPGGPGHPWDPIVIELQTVNERLVAVEMAIVGSGEGVTAAADRTSDSVIELGRDIRGRNLPR